MEVKIIGQMDNTIDHTFKSANRVYDKNGISPTINTCGGGGLQPKVIDSQIVAMRGRNPDNPSDRTVGSPTEQRLEPNSQGICNTLTSVQKDNLVMETVKIKQATSQGYIECEVGGVADLSFPESKTRRGRVQDKGQVSPTLMAGEQDICRIESVCAIDEQNMNVRNETFGTLTTDGSSPKHNNRVMEYTETQYRIRKLTPMECWSLMDFSQEDFLSAKLGSREVAKEILEEYPHLGKRAFTEVQRLEKMSNSQLYKQAGNSIILNVLVAILGQLIEGKEDVYKDINSTHFPNQQQ